MVLYLVTGLVLNTFLTYVVLLRVKSSKRVCIHAMIAFNFFYLALIQVRRFAPDFFLESVTRNLLYFILVGVILEAFLRLKHNLTRNSPPERKELFKYLNVVSMESYGSEFIIEEKIYKQSLLLEADKYQCIKSEDNGLSLITIADGHRLTVNQPHKVERSCYLLGGSTIFNAQVPNDLTICSQMQQIINLSSLNIAVHNFGVSGATSVNRMKFMRVDLTLRPNDIVILYFGVNDICFPGQTNRRNNFGDLIVYLINILLTTCRRNFQLFNKLKPIQKPSFRRLTRKYLKSFVIPAIIEGSRFCNAKDVKFLAVLQPSLFSSVNSNDEEWTELSKLPKSLNKSLIFGNSLFVSELEKFDFFVDGRSIFSKTSEQVFCDWVHTTSKGNELIARFLLKELVNRSWI